MTLLYIVLATLAGGLLSVVVAASLTVSVLGRVVRSLVSLSAGVLLGTALLNVLPEAFEGGGNAQELFLTLLAACSSSSCSRRLSSTATATTTRAMTRTTTTSSGFDARQAGHGGWSVLLGDSIHNFCDGVIVAAAFLTDPKLGIATALAIIAHEIPQEVGDYIVLLNAGFSRRRALAYNALSGLASVAGGVLGYFVVGPWEAGVPVPARRGGQQLHLRGRGRSAAAVAAPAAVVADARAARVAGRRARAGRDRARAHACDAH